MPLTYDQMKTIACDLVQRGRIESIWYEAWNRRKMGEAFPQIRLTLRIVTRRGRECHPNVRTCQLWARKVREAIVEEVEGKRVFGISIASGADVRTAADNTPQGRLPGSTWDRERLRVSGKLDRYSRKRH